MRSTSVLVSLLLATSLTAQQPVTKCIGKDLVGWRSPTGKWVNVGAVAQDPKNDRRLTNQAGNGILTNQGGTRNLLSTPEFGDIELHIEFLVPKGSNSGVYLQGRYEVQILDSYGKKQPTFGDCGGIYQRWANKRGFEGHPPRTNASKAPGEWQSFDITFRAPQFDSRGKKVRNARFVRVVHNGVTVHENVEVTGPTRAATYGDEKPKGPLMFQGDHGPVAYRNIRVQPLPAEPLPATERKPGGMHLYLLVGQSNMAGRGTVEEADRIAHPRVFALAEDGTWQPARDPIHFDKKTAGVGPGRTFGIVMATADPSSEIEIGLIPCAIGGSSIQAWRRGGYHPGTKTQPYEDMLRRVRIAVRDGDVRGILWHQGESDSGNEKVAKAYRRRLRKLVKDLRRDLHAPNVPFVVGELGRWRTGAGTRIVNAASRELPETMPHCGFVTAEGLQNRPDDRTHFTAASFRELGRRYAKVIQTLQRARK